MSSLLFGSGALTFALLIAYLDIIPCFFYSFNRGLLNNFVVNCIFVIAHMALGLRGR